MGLSLAAMGFAAAGLIVPIAGALLQEAIDVAVILNALRALQGLGAGHRPDAVPRGQHRGFPAAWPSRPANRLRHSRTRFRGRPDVRPGAGDDSAPMSETGREDRLAPAGHRPDLRRRGLARRRRHQADRPRPESGYRRRAFDPARRDRARRRRRAPTARRRRRAWSRPRRLRADPRSGRSGHLARMPICSRGASAR